MVSQRYPWCVGVSILVGKSKKTKLILETKLHRKLDEEHECSNCGRTVKPVKQYYHSNRGRVYVCLVCEEPIRNRSFKTRKKYIDALDKAVHTGHFHSRGSRGKWY